MHALRTLAALAVVVVLANMSLADGESTAAVVGEVQVNGKPLSEGKVLFHLDTGEFVGTFIREGKFKLDLILTGKHRITIEGDGVPEKYNSKETSPLEAEVRSGINPVSVKVVD